MLDYLFNAAKDIKDKELPPLIKRISNVVFVAGIASFIFQSFYFEYLLIDFLDYKNSFLFFIRGEFIVPFGIFFLVWTSTSVLGHIFFRVPNFLFGLRIKRVVVRFSFQNSLPEEKVEQARQAIVKYKDIKRQEALVGFFEMIKKSISTVDFRRLKANIYKVQSTLEGEFNLLIRGSIAAIVYFINVPHFGAILLAILLATATFIGLLLFIGYQIAEILPVILEKTVEEIDKYIDAIKS